MMELKITLKNGAVIPEIGDIVRVAESAGTVLNGKFLVGRVVRRIFEFIPIYCDNHSRWHEEEGSVTLECDVIL